MWNTISALKEIIIWSLPFCFLHLYISNVYNISIGQLVIWWSKNFSSTESSTAIIISFILIFLLFCLPLTSLINSFYLGLFGEKQTLVYLGNSSSSTSEYYKYNDINKIPFSGYNFDKKYNHNFNEINKLKYFIKDPGTKNIVGQQNKRLQLTAILSTLFFMIFLLIPALGVIHALTYPMYIDVYGKNAHFHGEAIKSFEIVLLDFKISKGLSTLIVFGGLILAIYFAGKLPEDQYNDQISPLPKYVRSGSLVSAIPIEINIQYEKRTNHDGRTSTYDSGYRNTIFRFDKDFHPSVYVTMTFDSEKRPNLEDSIKSHITSKSKMILKIDENLAIRPKE